MKCSRLDGLGQLRALLASGRKPGILRSLEFDFVEVDAGKAGLRGPRRTCLQPHRLRARRLRRHVVGFGLWLCRAFALTAEQAYTTLDLTVSYHRPISQGYRTAARRRARAFHRAAGGIRRSESY